MPVVQGALATPHAAAGGQAGEVSPLCQDLSGFPPACHCRAIDRGTNDRSARSTTTRYAGAQARAAGSLQAHVPEVQDDVAHPGPVALRASEQVSQVCDGVSGSGHGGEAQATGRQGFRLINRTATASSR